MLRNVFIVFGLLALGVTASLSASAADVASQVRLAKTHKRGVISPHHAAGAHVAKPTARKQAPNSPRASLQRKSPHTTVAGSRFHGRVARTRHTPSIRRVAPAVTAAAPVAEAVTLRRPARVFPVSPLIGSFDSLARQNEMAESEGLERILDEDDLADRIAQKLLVPVPASSALVVNGNLPENHKYCRPWTADFLADLAKTHAERFGHPIEVSSAVRTVEYQKQLMLTNGNAAAAEGDVVSPHLTGATVDVAKHGMSRAELNWMRSWLLPLQLAGTIDVEEEFRQKCFHITVYRNYVSPPPAPADKPHRRRALPRTQVASRDL